MICPEDINIYEPYLELVNYAIDRLKQDNKEPILLDAGCGHSTILEKEYKKCKLVLGVDKDREGLNKNKLIDKKIFADLNDMPLDDASVDIITSAWVLEHIKEPEKFASEINRVLKKGGYFIFIAPNIDGWFAFASSIIPQKLHAFINKILYKRADKDTFPAYYMMNSEEDIDDILIKKNGFRKLRFIYNDDPKYLGFCWITKPLAWLWHKTVMKDRFEKLRLHILGLYYKP